MSAQSPNFKIAIVGAGVAGAVLAHRLGRLPGVEVLCLERVAADDHSEAGTGLNVGPNAIKALHTLDPVLAQAVQSASLPWARWTTELADGTPLFDLPLAHVADNPGIRIRWSELYRVLRAAAGAQVRYGCHVTHVGPDPRDPARSVLAWTQHGVAHRMDGIDLLVACDGRYSQVREAFSGVPQPTHIGVAILRALVEDTSGGLVDDYAQWFNGAHRMLAFKVKPQHIYIAATFPIAPGAEIPAHWKTAEVMRQTWAPCSGQPLTPALAWVVDALCEQLPHSHWARMQEAPVCYAPTSGAGVLYLGDAAHGMAPTLGQGATQALEDACVAAHIIEQAWAAGDTQVAAWLQAIAAARTARLQFAMALSVAATDTMLEGADPVAGARWKTEPPFLADLSRLFRDVAWGTAQEVA